MYIYIHIHLYIHTHIHMPHTTFMQVCTGIAPWDAGNDPGAAWYKTWLLIKLTLKGVVFSFLFLSF